MSHTIFFVVCLTHSHMLPAKYVHKSERNEWSFGKAKSTIAESIEMGQTIGMEKLQEHLAEESEMYPLCDAIGLAYLSVLRDCEIHCSAEGTEVKRLGGLHVVGTSLHESRRIDNQVRYFSCRRHMLYCMLLSLSFLYIEPFDSGL